MRHYFSSLALLFCAFFSSEAQTRKPENLNIRPLQPNLYMYQTYNTVDGVRYGANALYLVTPAGVVLFDTPWDPKQFQPLLDSIRLRHGKNVVMCISTHYHEDRTGGITFLRKKGIATWSSAYTKALCRKYGKPQAAFTFQRDTTFRVGGVAIDTFYPGEGHTRDNIVLWLPGANVLYGGCLVKSAEATDLGYTGEANVKAWPATIRKLQKRFAAARFVIPGHDGGTGKNALSHTLKLLQKHD